MATDFFDQQQHARRRTGLMIVYFAIAVALIVASVYAVFTGIVIAGVKGKAPVPPIFDPIRLLAVSTVTLLVITSGSLFKMASLREGGGAVARMLGGRMIDATTTDPLERRLLNVVEEMAIASGTPVPPVYLLDEEPGINAFAAGFAPGDAAIGVTRGTVEHLDRDQLQGVIAHEFSHILNGDMRIDIRLIGILHGILLLALIGQLLMRYAGNSQQYSSRSRNSDDSDKKDNSAIAFFLMGVGLFLVGYIGMFFAHLIKCAVSRQREFLADASAVQFTRNPEGIAGALKKIGGLSSGSSIRNANAEQACHMFFGAGVPSISSLMATHPPLEERIRRIDPSFDGIFPNEDDQPVEVADEKKPKPSQKGGPGNIGAILPGVNVGGAFPVGAAAVLASVGEPRPKHIEYASALKADLPQEIVEAIREPFGASAIVYALLLDDFETVREKQLQGIAASGAEGIADEAARLSPVIKALGPESRLPLVDMVLPTLQQLSPGQYDWFRSNIDPLVRADGRVTLFEFALQRMLLRHLDRKFRQTSPLPVENTSLTPLIGSVGILVSSLARIGHQTPSEVSQAFAKGVEKLGPEASSLSLAEPQNCSLTDVDRALGVLSQVGPAGKKSVLDACYGCIAADGRITVEEAELLRAIADSLDCPMPPMLSGAP